ncbi:MAG: hypothetical protein ACR2NB_06890 [Solirubrobacteraceae bacterium]
MTASHQSALGDLRRAIDHLPAHTREVMIVAVARDTVIVGADTDRNGGACPMLAAHRRGARADFVAFAEAWDHFTGVARQNVCRHATPHERAVLTAQLQDSLDAIEEAADLGGAIAAHQALARSRRADEAASLGRDWLDDPRACPVRPSPRHLALA